MPMVRSVRTALVVVAAAGCWQAASAVTPVPDAAVTPLVHGTAHESLFAIGSDGTRAVAVGDMGAILGSDDGCRSWHPQAAPASSVALLDVVVNGDDAIAVGQNGTVLYRADAERWLQADVGEQARLLGVGANAEGLAFAVGAFGTVLKSEDRGRSWQRLAIDWSEFARDGFEPHLYAVDVGADGTVTIAGEFELILRSTDRGESWTAVHGGEASLFGLALDASGRGYAVGQNARVLRTDDGGRHWRPLAFDGASILLDVGFAGERVAVVGIRELRLSRDGGESWTAAGGEDVATHWYSGIAGCGTGDWLIAGHSGRLVRIAGQ